MSPPIDPREAEKAYGSYNKWARRLDISLTTVLGWRDAGKVPHWRTAYVAGIAEQDGKDIFAKLPKPKKARAA